MNNYIGFCLNISNAHASINLKLDDVLGTFHGLSYNDFILLSLLSHSEGGRMPVKDLVRPLGVQLSAVTRQLVLLEKTGMVLRDPEVGINNQRYVSLRPRGKKLWSEAIITAEDICSDAMRSLQSSSLLSANEVLSTLWNSDAFKV